MCVPKRMYTPPGTRAASVMRANRPSPLGLVPFLHRWSWRGSMPRHAARPSQVRPLASLKRSRRWGKSSGRKVTPNRSRAGGKALRLIPTPPR